MNRNHDLFALLDPPPPIVEINPDMDPIPSDLRQDAREALSRGDTRRFLSYASSDAGLYLVWANCRLLRRLEVYEPALLEAYVSPRINWWGWKLRDLRWLFRQADRTKLFAAGEPLPGSGPYVLYRGVAGSRHQKRLRGYSWTSSLDMAASFAERSGVYVQDPQVYQIKVSEQDVLAYTNLRQEQEFIVEVPDRLRPRRVA